jgi:hypothetical protein
MHGLIESLVSIPLRCWILSSVCVLGIVAACAWSLENEASRAKRARRRKDRELRALADGISSYAQSVHRRFPNGDVVVSEQDLAEELRKRSESVVTALNLLLNEEKVQRAPLTGYWRLRI